ncbi:MAG: protein kinase domain-containing protein, partial [Gemmatimonadaceae bacterium]
MDRFEQVRSALAGRYAIERELGSGGMATVYLADDLKHDRKVAIKVIKEDMASMLGLDRFMREIQVAAKLSHPNIMPLYDSGAVDGSPFYVMPYVSGESLRHKLQRDRQLPVAEAIALVRQVAAALTYAHARGLVHRDISPENILLHEGTALVTDFGIALALDQRPAERLTAHGMTLGKAEYMSPEQVTADQTLDARSDVYSLGCVLYELLAGEPPFTGATTQAIMAKRFTDPVPSVRRLRPAVPRAVDEALMTALAKAPADRFSSAAEFAAAFDKPPNGPVEAPSVAVLPFLNLSRDPDNEYFADGITEDVIAHLSKVRSLKVISRGSVMQFKDRARGPREIGATLRTATVLDGSVRRAGDRVRIVAELIDTQTDRNLWAETYDRQLTDIFAIQSDVAVRIAAALKTELSPDERARIGKEPTHSLRAYQLYLQGRHHFGRFLEATLLEAIGYFEQATLADPAFALAYAGIALCYAELLVQESASVPPREAYERAKEAVKRAIELDNTLGEAHGVLALLMFTYEFNWSGAEDELKTALKL